jgi:hypothetical protein
VRRHRAVPAAAQAAAPGRFYPPLIERFNGKRLFEHGLVHLMLLARRIERLFTRRLQTQLFMLVLAASSPAHAHATAA